jgi:flagellar basal-body rod protein FlgB
MTDGMEAITTSVLGLALDAASLRQQAIASNIANANVAGYTPLTVNFEAQLEDARRAIGRNGTLDASALSDVSPRLEFDAGTDALGLPAKVQLDIEMARMAQNGVQYQALVKGLEKHYAVMAIAVGDGKK